MSEPLANVYDFGAHQELYDLRQQVAALKSGGPGGTSDGMEARVAHLEEDMKELKADMKAVRTDVSCMKGKLDQLPTTIQLIGFVVAIFVAAGILRYFGH